MGDHPHRTCCSLASDLSVVLQREGFFLSVFLGKNETQKSPWFVATKRAQVTPLGRHALPRLPLIYQ